MIIENKAKPYADRRKKEAETLTMTMGAYLDEFDTKMSDMTLNIINFFLKFGTSLDKHRENLKKTQTEF